MKKLEFHESLNDIPLMPLHERDALADDIKRNGQLFPIILLNGKVIDGRNRYLACLSREIEPKTISLNPADHKSFIASANYFRKHWTTHERAHFAALMSIASERGNPESNAPNGAIPSVEPQITQEKAAKLMGVGRRTVQRAKAKIKGKTNGKHIRTGVQKDTEAVDAGGSKIPVGAMPYWNRKAEVTDLINAINAIKRKVQAIPKDDPLYAHVGLNAVLSDLRAATGRLMAAIPAHVCPYCKGEKPEACKACKGKGVISEYFYKTAVPKEMKPEQPF
jgi:hypothetical protein